MGVYLSLNETKKIKFYTDKTISLLSLNIRVIIRIFSL